MQFDSNGNLTLTKAEATTLATFASTDDNRPQLAAVWVEPMLLRAWATDGSRAVMARKVGGCFMGSCPPVPIPRDVVLNAVRMCRKATDSVVVYVGPARGSDDATRTLGAGNVVGLQAVDAHGSVRGSSHCPVPPDMTPVPIDQVLYVPERPKAPGSAFGMSPTLMAEALSAIGKAIGGGAVTVLPGADPEAPVGLRAETDDATEWTAVVMPFRNGADVAVDVDDAVAWAAERVRTKYGEPAAAAFTDAVANAKALPAQGETTDTAPTQPKRRGGGRRKKAA